MARITPGNRLYFYQLFSGRFGFGRQVSLGAVDEALAEEGLVPADVECAGTQELVEALGFARVAVFKKGRVYATFLHDEELDAIIERAGKPKQAGQAAQSGKPWKRRKQRKDPAPAKPRHKEPEPAPAPAQESESADAEPTPAAEPAPAAEAVAETVPAAEPAPAPEPASAAEPAPPAEPEAATAQAVVAEATPEPTSEPVAGTEPDSPAGAEAEPAPQPDAEAGPAPAAKPAPEPEQAPAPTHGISLTITYDPYDGTTAPEPEPDATPEPEAAPAVEPESEHRPAARGAVAAPSRVTSMTAATTSTGSAFRDLPQTLSQELYCKDDLLRVLYQALPVGVDAVSAIDEDWRVARSCGTLTGTRSKVTFPLRYLTAGGEPMTVTIKHTSQTSSGKRWALALVNGEDAEGTAHEPMLATQAPQADEGAWADLSAPGHLGPNDAPSPVRELAQFAVIGTWDSFLGTIAAAAAPERWNYPGEGVGKASRYGILREYMAVTFHRAQEQGRIAVAPDGSMAAMDTGLLTPLGEDLYACFDRQPAGSDIPWRFAGLACAGTGELGARMSGVLEELPEPPSYLERLSDVVPEWGRSLVLDTDSLLGSELGRLPRAFLADGVAANSKATALLERAVANADASAGVGGLAADDVRDLARAIKADPGSFRRMRRQLEDAAEGSFRRVRASYRLAAPAYDPATNTTKLLVPLCLVGEGHVDCALAIERLSSGNLMATSVLSLPRAYACARVASAEQPRWLDPSVVLA